MLYCPFTDTYITPNYLVCTNVDDYPDCFALAESAGEIIACDGAIQQCQKYGITPDLLLGDLDSCSEHHEVKQWRLRDQNTTDTEKALCYIRQQEKAKTRSVVLIGLSGGRFDHSLYHLKLLWQFRDSFASIDWLGANDHCRIVSQSCVIHGAVGKRISFFAPWGDATITLPDAKYSVSNYILSMRTQCSLSNAFRDNSLELQILSGSVLVCLAL